MDMHLLSQKINSIEMSEEMKKRMIHHCYSKMEEPLMNKNKKTFQKPMIAIASMVLCFFLIGATALASSDKLQGFFRDIIRWDGAVIGTSYEQATDEITMNVVSVSDELTVTTVLVNPNTVPYMTFEAFGIGEYKIVDANEKVVIKGSATDYTEIVDGKATFSIPASELVSGNYKLVVSSFVGSSKADQPLVLHGNWKCTFTR